MTRSEVHSLLMRRARAWREEDLDAIMADHAPDVVHVSPHGRRVGAAAMRDANARYLATVGRVRPEYKERFASAIIGEDGVRVHTVAEEDNPLYWRLLHRAAETFGMPVLYNTSFNLFGDPLVCTPRDAVRSFYSSGIDAMIAGYFFVEK